MQNSIRTRGCRLNLEYTSRTIENHDASPESSKNDSTSTSASSKAKQSSCGIVECSTHATHQKVQSKANQTIAAPVLAKLPLPLKMPLKSKNSISRRHHTNPSSPEPTTTTTPT